MSESRLAWRRLAHNPFHVLGLRPDCSRAEVEREGQKLLGMLEVELSVARTYSTPVGIHERSPEDVREAMAELRDPERRLLHELWAALPAPTSQPTTPEDPARRAEPHEQSHPGFTMLGFRGGSGR
jgi:hypothetical protein